MTIMKLLICFILQHARTPTNLRITLPIVTTTKWLLKQLKFFAVLLVLRTYSTKYSLVIVFLNCLMIVPVWMVIMTTRDLGLFHHHFQYLGISKIQFCILNLYDIRSQTSVYKFCSESSSFNSCLLYFIPLYGLKITCVSSITIPSLLDKYTHFSPVLLFHLIYSRDHSLVEDKVTLLPGLQLHSTSLIREPPCVQGSLPAAALHSAAVVSLACTYFRILVSVFSGQIHRHGDY